MNFKLIGVAIAAISLCACSTVVNGSNQLVKVSTGDVSGADCKITGGSDLAVNESVVTPGEVKLPRSKKALDVSCEKAGYDTAMKKVHSKVEGSTAGNIIAGGVVGIGVDALTGAIYRYPDTISILMYKAGMSPAAEVEEMAEDVKEEMEGAAPDV